MSIPHVMGLSWARERYVMVSKLLVKKMVLYGKEAVGI